MMPTVVILQSLEDHWGNLDEDLIDANTESERKAKHLIRPGSWHEPEEAWTTTDEALEPQPETEADAKDDVKSQGLEPQPETEAPAIVPNEQATANTMALFLNEVPLRAHVQALRKNRAGYVVALLWCTTQRVAMTRSTKVRALTAAWGTGERELAAKLILSEHGFGVPVVLGS
eukprot:COSAG01_NODE_24761_length_767_cov_1.428144_1_plen_173_part_10